MKVRLTTSRWDQRTAKGIVRRRRGDLVSVKDDVADWLIRSGAAELVGRAPAPTPEQSTGPQEPPAPEDVIEGLDGSADDADGGQGDADGDGGSDGDDDETEDAGDDESATARPAQSAPKAAWVAYAVSRGVPAKEAEAMDKPKLIARTA
ncbi:hypothetical protein G6031_09615 [Dietzia sp. CQ4]|uniref:hypothetical protein n=1 Tax=Dietzia sp. (strain CQ4) TaxID=370437 RepID=UPI0015FD4E9F|nr:hypothetical protein [Dietzia sp. CQ4]MBB1034645.1 hypothetical protein [Dietzia sp. CQ4]